MSSRTLIARLKQRTRCRLYYQQHQNQIREQRRLKRLEGKEERQKLREQKHRAAIERRKTADREYQRLKRTNNKEMSRKYGRLRYSQNREQKLTQVKASAKKHPLRVLANSQRKRARKRNATIGIIDFQVIIERDRGKCQICKKRIRKPDFSFDHIIPLFLGGSHSQNNLQLAHKSCNSSRGIGRLPAQTRFV